jgi:hypothetical protein
MRRLPTRFIRHPRSILGILPLLLTLVLPSCSNDGGGVPQEPAIDFNEELQRAWTQFRSQDFSTASTSFELLSGGFPDAPEPRTGLGWCAIVADDLEGALDIFEDAGGMHGDRETLAGIAVAASATGRDSLAVEAATAALDPMWTFVGDPEFGYTDLVYMKALGEFNLRRYDACYASLLLLIPNLQIDMEAYDFREDLFAALESLREQV